MMATTSDCGCCGGTSPETPREKFNRPGLPAVAYRTGTWQDFRATLLARLSSTDYPALAALTTRSDDDWTIALCDACATLGDVLTFYQERIANEFWLRTATERRSVLELARLIGYLPAPGVAASTALAFTLEPAPGQPALAAQPATIPIGTRVQSVPDPDQDPHTFETVAAITARVEWNAMSVQTNEPMLIEQGLTELYIAGTDNQIQQGDAILIVGSERENHSDSDRWDVRWLDKVTTDSKNDLTRVVWSKGLGSWYYVSPPAAEGTHIYVFRQRAALFGNNAPDPSLFSKKGHFALDDDGDWTNQSIVAAEKRIDLDATYPKIVNDSWIALTGGVSAPLTLSGYVELYRVKAVAQRSQARYAISGKYTTLTVYSGENLDPAIFGLRQTGLLAQSEELALAARPLLYPLYGSKLALGSRELELAPGQLVAVSGKRQRVVFAADVTGIVFSGDTSRPPRAGESFVLLDAPRKLIRDGMRVLAPEELDPSVPLGGTLLWTLEDHDGTTISVEAAAGKLVLAPALEDDKTVSDICTIAKDPNGVHTDVERLDRTTLTLQLPLANCYERSTVAVNANVAPATEGESASEIGGSGDASAGNQSFALKQFPLTYVSDSTAAGGSAATLEIQVNGLRWNEAPTLYGHGPRDRVYALRQDDQEKTTVAFGDGEEGARLPSGQNNVHFSYRKGLGAAGNLRAGQLTTLLTRPAGVKAAINPEPSTGGQDAETLDSARVNLPLRVLTLDRAVSIEDYADFARSFAGIAKARAIWIPDSRGRGIHITIAGPSGETFDANDATPRNLVGALRNYGDPLIKLDVRSYAAVGFALKARVKVADDRDPDAVLAAVGAALSSSFSFDQRGFGQPVTLDEVYAVTQRVAGVIAVDIDRLYRCDAGAAPPQPAPRLLAALPAVKGNGTVNPAELLTIEMSAVSLSIPS